MGHRSFSTAEPAIDVQAWLRDNGVTYSGTDVPAPMLTFHEGKWPDWIRSAIQNQGFDKPTLIQSISWGVALKGRDMIGIAATGTGKTLGFVLPCLVAALKNPRKPGVRGPSSLILCPTRELAQQTFNTLTAIARNSNLRAVCLYGGADRQPQQRALYLGVDIIVATPGRLLDLMQMEAARLNRVVYLVFDEADRMLDMGFEDKVTEIFNQCPTDKQTLMWSATWPKEVQQLAQKFLQDPVMVTVGSQDLAANKDITQEIIVCERRDKLHRLQGLLKGPLSGQKVLVFCATKMGVDYLQQDLQVTGVNALSIHGDKSQASRDSTISAFREESDVVLVATDVAARGLDVRDINAVVNYDMPNNMEDYVHRIGRTARAGAKGVAYSMVTPDDGAMVAGLVDMIEKAGQTPPPELLKLWNRPSSANARPQYRPWGSRDAGRPQQQSQDRLRRPRSSQPSKWSRGGRAGFDDDELTERRARSPAMSGKGFRGRGARSSRPRSTPMW